METRSISTSLPVVSVSDAINEHTIDKPTTEANEEAQDLKNVRIMVADDSFPILKMISMVLKEHGALITLARDGQEAINHCESVVTAGGNDFHLILTDIQMPNMDGLALIQLVRSMEKELGLEPKIIIGISAFYGDHLAKKTMEAGMDAFLPKPFNYDTFMTVYHDIVQRRKNVAIQTNIVGSNNEEIMAIPGSKSVQQQPVVLPSQVDGNTNENVLANAVTAAATTTAAAMGNKPEQPRTKSPTGSKIVPQLFN